MSSCGVAYRRIGRVMTVVAGAVAVGLGGCSGFKEPRIAKATLAATADRLPRADRELVITDLEVVEDPLHTQWTEGAADVDAAGAWTFGRLIDNISPQERPTPAERTGFVLRWLKAWENDQAVNSFTVPARPMIRNLVIDPWRVESGCAPDTAAPGAIASDEGGAFDDCVLDFGKAPFRLLAIVNRPDLRIPPGPAAGVKGSGGQGRFVFGVVGKDAHGLEQPLSFTVIFEYRLPVATAEEIVAWASRWHELGASADMGPAFADQLHNVVSGFMKRNAIPGEPNGSALLQIRTNEVALSTDSPPLWEMREFILSPSGEQLVETTVKQEPDASFNGSPLLAAYLQANEAGIVAGTVEMPESIMGTPFLAGRAAVPADLAWQVPEAAPAVRNAFALGTCSGCHLSETGGVDGTNFLHVRNRVRGVPATLSPFLLAELSAQRLTDFTALLGAAPLVVPEVPPAPVTPVPPDPGGEPAAQDGQTPPPASSGEESVPAAAAATPAAMVQGPGLDIGNEAAH